MNTYEILKPPQLHELISFMDVILPFTNGIITRGEGDNIS